MTAELLILTALLTTAVDRQTPTPPQPSSSVPDDRLAVVGAPAPATVEGCVATNREVHGGPTNLAERMGLDDGWILTAARVVKGRAPAPAPGRTAKRPMYAIEGLSDEQLKPHLGRRVRIEGSFTKGDGTADGHTRAALPVLTVKTVRQIRGECPAPTSDEN
jgi:hypothetical protein